MHCRLMHDAAQLQETLMRKEALPRERLHSGQICDGRLPGPATREGLIHDARCERLLPGEGDIAWARAAVAATRKVLGDNESA